MKHKLVIILVNYNGFEVTKACLKSIADSEGSQPFVVLVDNASNHPNKLDQLKSIYPNLELIKNSKNIGFGKANNIGIQWAQEYIDFEFLALLNNDTIISENAFTNMMDDFQKPNVGIATCRIMYEDQKDLIWYGGADIDFKHGEPQIVDMGQQPTTEGALKSREVTFASGCLIVFSKESLHQLKGFDERFFMYAEDLELSIRCGKEGLKIWYNADTVIYHKVQGSFSESESFKGLHPKNKHIAFQFYERKANQWLTMRKHLRGFRFLKFSAYFWFKYKLILAKLLLLSPKRFSVLKAHFKVLTTLMFQRNKIR